MTNLFNRRRFLKVSATATGGILIATNLPGCGGSSNIQADQAGFEANAFLQFSNEGDIVFTLPRVEMGQGTYTGLTTVIAEELEVDPENIKIDFAPADEVYNNPEYYNQMTGGSNSLSVHFSQLSQAGADTRQLFINAAAQIMQVDAAECSASNSQVQHIASGRSLQYRELVSTAATLEIPTETALKTPEQYKYIGKQRQRLDAAAKTFGKAQFGIDIKLDNMLYAVVARPPVHGGQMTSFDASSAMSMPGVKHILSIETGLAVVADSYWQARQALPRVEIEWDHGPMADLSSDSLIQQYQKAADDDAGDKVRTEGKPDEIFESEVTLIESEYSVPFLAHATMEPQNCVAHVQEDRCDVWAPTQGPDLARVWAAEIAGLSRDKVHIHTPFLGGGFGRRILHDYVSDAVSISKQIKQPVKVIWSREDDIKHDSYRPATYNRMKAAITKDGKLSAWHHQIVGPSLMRQFVPVLFGAMAPEALPDGMVRSMGNMAGNTMGTWFVDSSSTEGADDLPYDIPNLDIRNVHSSAGVPILWWRSVGHSQNAFMVEGFLDEAAHAAGRDPFEFRASLLKNDPRRLAVLTEAAKRADWGASSAANRFKGIAVHKCFGSYVAQVAEIEIISGQIRVHRVHCVVDCGLVVNPDMVVSQMESGIIFGLTAALYGEINHKDGQVVQSNFHDYPLLRINESPEIDVHIISSTEAPSGVGEPAVPPIMPAVANAVFAATGQRLRTAPLRLS